MFDALNNTVKKIKVRKKKLKKQKRSFSSPDVAKVIDEDKQGRHFLVKKRIFMHTEKLILELTH